MARSWAATAAVAVTVLVAVSGAARVPDPFEDGMWGQSLERPQDMKAWLGYTSHESEKSLKAIVAVRYIVSAHKACKFVKEWKRLEGSVRKEKGNIVFDLKKTLTDNIIFVGYGEWESGKDLREHVRSSHARDFYEYLADEDIVVKFEPLLSPCSKEEERPEDTDGKDKDPVAILSKIIVPPKVQEEFVDTWKDTVKSAVHTKGNRVYSLRKVLTDNVGFYLYSSWDKFEDFVDFLKSDSTKTFGEFVVKHDIVFFTSPLKKIGDQPE